MRKLLVMVLLIVFGVIAFSQFRDVPEDHWIYDYVHALASRGIVPTDVSYFHPDSPLLRSDAALWLYNLVTYVEKSEMFAKREDIERIETVLKLLANKVEKLEGLPSDVTYLINEVNGLKFETKRSEMLMKKDIESMKKDLASLKNKAEEIEAIKKEFDQKIMAVAGGVDSNTASIRELKAQMNNLKGDIEKLAKKDPLESYIKTHFKNLDDKTTNGLMVYLKEKFSETDDTINAIIDSLDELYAFKEKYEKDFNKLDEDFKAVKETAYKSLNLAKSIVDDLFDVQDVVDEIQTKMDEIYPKVEDHEVMLGAMEDTVEKLESDTSYNTFMVKNLQVRFNAYKKKTDQEIEKIVKQYEAITNSMQSDIKDLSDTINTMNGFMKMTEEKVSANKKLIDELDNKLEEQSAELKQTTNQIMLLWAGIAVALGVAIFAAVK